VPGVKLSPHDLSGEEVVAGLHNATLELGVLLQPTGEQTTSIEFELLRTYHASQRRSFMKYRFSAAYL
jgi:hypothetical protein